MNLGSLIGSLVILAFSAASAEDAVQELATVEAAIPASLALLPEPVPREFPGGIAMDVTANGKDVRGLVNQGLNCLHGGWEFEASRHFAAAMRKDPDCLLAHWGMIMCLLTPSPETLAARGAAADRLLYLIETGHGSELERGYAYGLVKYMEEGPSGSANAFRKVAERFPDDLQAGVLTAVFSRGGYDESGSPTPSQEAAEKRLLDLMGKSAESPIPLNALLMIRAEAPDLSESIKLASTLCRISPDFPAYHQILGHCQWRCGQHSAASDSFAQAANLYQSWMKENSVVIADCPEWVKAECYRITAMVSAGDVDAGLAAARQLAATPLPEKRPSSPGARGLLWDAKTLPARILMHRGRKGDFSEAGRSLPKPEELKSLRPHSLAYWWIDGLRLAAEARRLIAEEKWDEANAVIAALSSHGEGMAATQNAASKRGERSEWNRAFRALEILTSETRGHWAMAGPKNRRGSAFNWFTAAAERQRNSPSLTPPLVLTPMAAELGNYHLMTNKPDEAVDDYKRALALFPGDSKALAGLLKALKALDRSDEASEVEATIQSLKTK